MLLSLCSACYQGKLSRLGELRLERFLGLVLFVKFGSSCCYKERLSLCFMYCNIVSHLPYAFLRAISKPQLPGFTPWLQDVSQLVAIITNGGRMPVDPH